jgi:hypothetical protein
MFELQVGTIHQDRRNAELQPRLASGGDLSPDSISQSRREYRQSSALRRDSTSLVDGYLRFFAERKRAGQIRPYTAKGRGYRFG